MSEITIAPDARDVAMVARAVLATPADWPGPDREQEWAEHIARAALAARPAPTVNGADVDVWVEWLFDIGYPFDTSWPENPPPVDHAVLARLWNERDNWRISDDDAEACVRYEAGLTAADDEGGQE